VLAAGFAAMLAAAGAELGRELIALGAALLAAALLARAGRRIGLPTIPLFMIAGVLAGPHTPGLVLVRDPAQLGLLTTLGLVLLLFHLGLEFSLDDLLAGGRKLLVAGVVYLALNVGGGIGVGLGFGWGGREALVVGGIIGISSSAIVTKLVVELRRLANPETRLLLGIIVVEDVFLAIYLALLQPAIGEADPGLEAALTVVRAFAFLAALTVIARWGRRVIARLLGRGGDDELLTVSFVGLAVIVAGVAATVGVSEAIGAFLAGQMVAATPLRHRIERLVLPLRDLLAATFFFAFGLSIDPGEVATVLGPVGLAVGFTVAANLAAGAIAAKLHGYGRQEALNIGLTVLARGEFSLILASLAAVAGLDGRLSPFTAGYVLVLALIGPLAASRSDRLARRPRRPRRLGAGADSAPAEPATERPGPPPQS